MKRFLLAVDALFWIAALVAIVLYSRNPVLMRDDPHSAGTPVILALFLAVSLVGLFWPRRSGRKGAWVLNGALAVNALMWGWGIVNLLDQGDLDPLLFGSLVMFSVHWPVLFRPQRPDDPKNRIQA